MTNPVLFTGPLLSMTQEMKAIATAHPPGTYLIVTPIDYPGRRNFQELASGFGRLGVDVALLSIRVASEIPLSH